ncbi:hypothetical protein AcV5_003107 [Taiwanofungus camphoratus]|nr:hypothetical protein AcV5_003107 [Antrodia cinnamomea]
MRVGAGHLRDRLAIDPSTSPRLCGLLAPVDLTTNPSPSSRTSLTWADPAYGCWLASTPSAYAPRTIH